MALEPEEYEFGFPTFKREMELLEETAESSFEKGEPSQRDDVPERFESLHDQHSGYCPWDGTDILDEKSSVIGCCITNRDEILKQMALERFMEKVRSSPRPCEDATDVLDQMERYIILKRKYKVLLEMRGEKKERIRDEITRSAAKVKSDFEKVKNMLNCFNPKILNNQLAEPGSSYEIKWDKQHQAYQKAKSEIPNRLRYCKDEIRTTAELLEQIFQEIDENESFTKSSAYEGLRKFNNSLLDHFEKCDSQSLAKIAESSVAKVEPQSKGVVSKKNALRRQHNSQRDDPDEELSRDQVEMKATLVECVFRIPQQPRFITALGYTPILVA